MLTQRCVGDHKTETIISIFSINDDSYHAIYAISGNHNNYNVIRLVIFIEKKCIIIGFPKNLMQNF